MGGYELVTSLSILMSISFVVQVERTIYLQMWDSLVVLIVSCWPSPYYPDLKTQQIRCHSSISKSMHLSHVCICVRKCVCVVHVIGIGHI